MVIKRKLPSQIQKEEGSSGVSVPEFGDVPAVDKKDSKQPSEGITQESAPVAPDESLMSLPSDEEDSLVQKNENVPLPPIPDFESEESSVIPDSQSEDIVSDTPLVAPPSFGDEALGDTSSSSASHSWVDDVIRGASHESETSQFSSDSPSVDISSDDGWNIPGVSSQESDVSDLQEKAPVEKKKKSPLWQQGSKGRSAPILPGQEGEGVSHKSVPWGTVAAGVSVVLVVAGVFAIFMGDDEKETAEKIARVTQTLATQTESLPDDPMGYLSDSANDDGLDLEPEKIVTMEESGFLPPPGVDVSLRKSDETLVKDKDSSEEGTTKIDFVNVTKEEAEEPIQSDDTEEMPEDLSLFAKMQRDIMKARDQKASEKVVKDVEAKVEKEELSKLSREELDKRNQDLTKKLEEELQAYRQRLAGTSKAVPPKDFFREREAEREGSTFTAESAESGAIPLPPKSMSSRSQSPSSQGNNDSLYVSNPNKLPVVPEPKFEQKSSVRTLDDFDVTMFEPEKERVRIPKGVRPSFKATDFPDLQILSLVPNKGIIAVSRGRQGILLLGESLEGWELVSIHAEYAEFSNGKRKYMATIGR